MGYALPREIYDDLTKKVGKESATKIMNAFESILDTINQKTEENIIEKKEIVKSEIYNKLKEELATKEFVRAEINEVKTDIESLRGEVKENSLLLKILIGISTFALTIFNPNFIELINKIFKG